ncbi:MAG TPA: hypothetical protein DDW49_00955 [Deltaproteobacteria bacterium]|nr:MAG: hypothetical protein A2048_07620 [Deltaproteobacteria bacterium GWA2_45_12]HBF11953.1 hypothetical protein [Deltaproteobacteria bacterium]
MANKKQEEKMKRKTYPLVIVTLMGLLLVSPVWADTFHLNGNSIYTMSPRVDGSQAEIDIFTDEITEVVNHWRDNESIACTEQQRFKVTHLLLNMGTPNGRAAYATLLMARTLKKDLRLEIGEPPECQIVSVGATNAIDLMGHFGSGAAHFGESRW